MATTNTWEQVVSKITGVANRGAFSKTYTPSTSRQTQNGSAGYYSSITTVCNAVSLSGNAATSQVLTGRTFYTTSLTKQTGTMANRGNLNWSGSNTTYRVPAGYYSGGTLDSRTSYNNGYNAGVSAGKLGSNSYSANYTSIYGYSHQKQQPYNCIKNYQSPGNGIIYTSPARTGNFLFIVCGYQGAWSHEFTGVSVTRASGSGTITQRYRYEGKFPQLGGWNASECGTVFIVICQISGANNMTIRVTNDQSYGLRCNAAVLFLT